MVETGIVTSLGHQALLRNQGSRRAAAVAPGTVMTGFNLTIADQLIIGASGKLLCNGGVVTSAGSTKTVFQWNCGSNLFLGSY